MARSGKRREKSESMLVATIPSMAPSTPTQPPARTTTVAPSSPSVNREAAPAANNGADPTADSVLLDQGQTAPEQQMARLARQQRVPNSTPIGAGHTAGFTREWDSASTSRRQQIVSRTMLNPRSLVNGDAGHGLPPLSPSTVRELAETPHPMGPRIRQRLMEGTASPIERRLQERSGTLFQEETQALVRDGRAAQQALQLRQSDQRRGVDPAGGRAGGRTPLSEADLRAQIEAGQRAQRHLEVIQGQSLAGEERWVGRVDRSELDRQVQQTLSDPEVRERLARATTQAAASLPAGERTRLLQEQRDYLNGDGFQRRLALFPPEQRERQTGLESARMALLDPSLASGVATDDESRRVGSDILGRPTREWMDHIGMIPRNGIGAVSGAFAIADSMLRSSQATDGSAGWHAASAGINAVGIGAMALRGPVGLAAQGAIALGGSYIDGAARRREEQSLLGRLGVLQP